VYGVKGDAVIFNSGCKITASKKVNMFRLNAMLTATGSAKGAFVVERNLQIFSKGHFPSVI
jgi:hypothetical protein